MLGGNDAHPLQAFWGMPRRIRLDIRAAQPGERCGITGQPDTVFVTGFRTRRWGTQYVNAAHFHPLTPTYRTKAGEPPLAIHPQPDGIGYRHWHRLVSPDPADQYQPAATVMTFQKRKPMGSAGKAWAEARLLIGGYDMDNMKARSFIEAEMPVFFIENDQLRHIFLRFARNLAEGATQAATMLRGAIRDALLIEDSDRTTVDDARQSFFERTTGDFWAMLRATLDSGTVRSEDEFLREAARMEAAARWQITLRSQALGIFDETAPLDPLAPNAAGVLQSGQWKPPPIVAARRNLSLGLQGYGKAGAQLYIILGLALPEKKPAKPKPEKPRKAARNG